MYDFDNNVYDVVYSENWIDDVVGITEDIDVPEE